MSFNGLLSKQTEEQLSKEKKNELHKHAKTKMNLWEIILSKKHKAIL
jgi:hypothetical protein